MLLTLGHELVHAQQMLDTRANDSSALREFEAFSWSLFVFDSTDVCERIRGRQRDGQKERQRGRERERERERQAGRQAGRQTDRVGVCVYVYARVLEQIRAPF